jgi:GNAT superfamily N-acetyltransferase
MLRQARRTDIPAMHRVRTAVLENCLTTSLVTEADYLAALEESGRGWVIDVDGEIAGFAVGKAADGNIWALFVDPRHEGRGYGRSLHDVTVARGCGREDWNGCGSRPTPVHERSGSTRRRAGGTPAAPKRASYGSSFVIRKALVTPTQRSRHEVHEIREIKDHWTHRGGPHVTG